MVCKMLTFDFNLQSKSASDGNFVIIKSGHDERFALKRQTVLGQTQRGLVGFACWSVSSCVNQILILVSLYIYNSQLYL